MSQPKRKAKPHPTERATPAPHPGGQPRAYSDAATPDQGRRAGARGGPPGNSNARKTGFYSDRFTDEELALIAAFVSDPTVDDEIWMQRVLNRRLLAHVQDADVPVEQLITIAQALAVGTGRVARLLRDRRALSGTAADGIASAIAAALDEFSNELGIEL